MISSRADIVRNIIWSSANIFTRYLASFLVTALIAVFYNPEQFGRYQLALTYISIFEAITFVHSSYVRNYLVVNKDKESIVSSFLVFQSAIISFVTVVGCLLAVLFADDREFWLLVLLMSARMIFRVFEYISVIADVRLRNDLFQKSQIVMNGSFNLSRVVVILSHLQIGWLYFCSTLMGFFSAAYQVRMKKILGITFKWQYSANEFKKILKGSFGLSVVGFLSILQSRFSSIILESKMLPSIYGNYQLVFKLIEPATAIGLIILSANYTILAHDYQNSKEVFLKRFLKISSISLFISLVAGVFLFAVPRSVFDAALGTNYVVAFESLQFGWVLLIGNTFAAVMANFDILKGDYLKASVQFLAVCVLNVILLLLVDRVTVSDALLIGGVSAVIPAVFRCLFIVLSFWMRPSTK